MKPIKGNKRKMDQTDDEVIPGTPQQGKHGKKKQRKKSTKCVDCENMCVNLTENLMVNDVKEPVVVDNDFHDQHFDELLHGIDFLDDFGIPNEVSKHFNCFRSETNKKIFCY